jgi:Bacterial Ig-like domain (group 1)/Regulator of chromosome condensation (RCC1) repeat
MHRSALIIIGAAAALAACDGGTGPHPVQAPAGVDVVSGSGQTGAVGAALAEPVVARVTDEDGDPVEGQLVVFRVIGGGGSVRDGADASGADGMAADRWTLGVAAGEQRLEARVMDAGGTTLAADTFVATAHAGAAAQLVKTGGDGQAGAAGQPLAAPLAVRVRDAFGNPVAGATVQWQPAAGSGSVAPASSVSDATGTAQTQWTLGAAGGVGTVSATMAGAVPVTFTATGTVAPAGALQIVAGAGQTALVGTELANAIVAEVHDAAGHPLPGQLVVFRVISGGGSVRLGAMQTGPDGRAFDHWTLGMTAGTQRLEARVMNAAGATLAADSVTAAASAAAPSQIAITGGDGQAGVPGQPLPVPLGVRLRDPFGNVVPGIAVQWQVLTGGGSVLPASSMTDADGEATTVWTLGAGGGTVRASAPGVAAVTFSAAASPVPAAATVFAGNGQEAFAGDAPPNPVVVRVLDAAGRPVPGAAVQWLVASGGGAFMGAQTVTDGSGLAQAQWLLGPRLGAVHRVEAWTPGVPGPATFTATATLPPNAVLVKASGDGQTGRARFALPQPATVEARLADTRPLQGVQIAWSALDGGSPIPTVSTTDAAGRAATAWTLGAPLGTQRLTARMGTRAVVFTATATPANRVTAAPASLTLETGETDSLAISVDGPDASSGAAWITADSTIAGVYPQPGSRRAAVLGRRPGTTQVIVRVGDGADTVPVTVQPIPEAFETLSAGLSTACALTASGRMYCWGARITGTIAPGGPLLAPVRMAEGMTFDWLSVGEGEPGRQAVCAGAAGGQAYCWGSGSASYVGASAAPTPVQGGHAWRTIEVAGSHACGITTAGDLYCFGNGANGRLGNGSTASSTAPVPVIPGVEWIEVAVGQDWSCGLLTTGSAYCWGPARQLGRSVNEGSSTPVPVDGGLVLTQIDAGGRTTCGVDINRNAWCWGGAFGLTPALVPGKSFSHIEVAELAPRTGSTLVERICGVGDFGISYCWTPAPGALGPGAPASTTLAFRHVEGFHGSACGITTDDVVYCWGANDTGQLGQGDRVARPNPTRVVGQP